MMTENRPLGLNRRSATMLAHLVGGLRNVRPGHPLTYMTYGDVHRALRLPGTPQDLENQGLADLANAILEAGLPSITGLVVRQDSRMPGDGYFTVNNRPIMDFAWWEDEVRRIKAFDWQPYLRNPEAPPAEVIQDRTPVAADAVQVTRVETTTYRVLRDTVVAKRIKRLHEYKCQICKHTIQLADGTRYAEAHHVRPLGSPHDGPDIEQNIVCVCPNHHAELDYFARPIDLTALRMVPGHFVDQQFIDYHNNRHSKATLRSSGK